MNAYELTLKQYQKQKLAKYKSTKYWENALKQTKERRKQYIIIELEKYKRQWFEEVTEHGRYNRLENKVIYSFDKEFGRKCLLHTFRGDRKGIEGWINSDAINY